MALSAVQDVSEQQVRSGALPERLAPEGVLLRYAVDCQLDQMLARVYAGVTTPPLLPHPLGKVMSTIRGEACKMELRHQSADALCQLLKNQLSLVGPPGCFIYAGEGSEDLGVRGRAAGCESTCARCNRVQAVRATQRCSGSPAPRKW